MSRIGRHPIAIPAGVTVEIAENNVVTVKGPKGTSFFLTYRNTFYAILSNLIITYTFLL